jgi:hypothetical protein
MTREPTDADAERPDYSAASYAGWAELSPETRAQLLLQGAGFPGETATEIRCRIKRDLKLYDDDDLAGLLDKSIDTLVRMRVKGTGPAPIRVAREVFYDQADVHAWIRQHRDEVSA